MANDKNPRSYYNPESYDRQYYPEQSRRQQILAEQPRRSSFLNDVSKGLKDIDEYTKKLNTIENGYNKMLNDQVDIIAKISKARSAEESRAYKSQLSNAQQYSEEQLRIMKQTYSAQRKYLDSKKREEAKEAIRHAESEAREVLKVVKRIDGEMYKQLNEGSSATLVGKLKDFSSSLSDVYQSFNINRLVTSGIQGAQQNVGSTNQLQQQNGLTNQQSFQVGQGVKQQIRDELGSSMKTSEVMQQVSQAGYLVGGDDVKAIAKMSKTLAARNELGLGNDITNSIDTARALGLDPNAYAKTLTDQQSTLTRTKTADGSKFKIRQQELAQQLDSFQSGIAANITDPNQLDDTNKNLMGMFAAYQNQSPVASNAVTTLLQNAINDPTAASSLGLSPVAINRALASGDVDSINQMVFSASNRLSKSGENGLAIANALGLDAGQFNALKSIYGNKDSIQKNTQLAQDAKVKDSDELLKDPDSHKGGSALQKSLRPVFDKITSIGEYAASELGVDPADVNSQLSTIINLLIAIAGSDLIKTTSKFFGADGLGGSIASAINKKLIGTTAASGASGGIISGLTGGGGLSALTGKGVLQAFGKVGGPLAIGMSLIQGIQGALNSNEIFGSTEGKKLSSKFASGLSYTLAGSGEGGILGALGNGAKGAAIGTMIAPGIGTVLGALIGGVLGSIGPEKIAKALNLETSKTTNEKETKKETIYGKGKWNNSTNVITGRDSSKDGYVAPFSRFIDRVVPWFKGEDSKDAKEAKKNSHKDGLPKVPKDEYKATLHKDEAVLTKEQANTWREQQRGTSSTKFFKNAIKNAKFTAESKTIKGTETSNSSGEDSEDVDADSVSVKKSGQAFVDSIAKAAMVNYKKNNMLPSFFIAQAAHESAGGTSYLAEKDNNLGGNKMPNKYASKGGSIPTDGTGGQYAHFDTKNDWAMGQVDYYAGSMGNGVRGQTSVEGTVNAIRNNGYFTAPPAAYLAGVRSWIKQFDLEGFDKKNGVKATAYRQGTPWVPETQLALLHKGEMVVPQEHNPTNPKNSNKVNVKNTGLDSNLEQLLTWGFNKVVDAIIGTSTTDPLSVPNIPEGYLIRN